METHPRLIRALDDERSSWELQFWGTCRSAILFFPFSHQGPHRLDPASAVVDDLRRGRFQEAVQGEGWSRSSDATLYLFSFLVGPIANDPSWRRHPLDQLMSEALACDAAASPAQLASRAPSSANAKLGGPAALLVSGQRPEDAAFLFQTARASPAFLNAIDACGLTYRLLEESSARPPDAPDASRPAFRDTMAAAEVPFTTFQGWLKCHRPEFTNELGAAALRAAFPGFLEKAEPSPSALRQFERKWNAGIGDIIWSGKAARRFAGDDQLDRSLPRGRYYTVCLDGVGSDRQTLANELMAYADPELCGEVHVWDLADPELAAVETHAAGRTRSELVLCFSSRRHKYNPFLLDLANITGQAVDRLVAGAKVTLPYFVEYRRIERTSDLRLPRVQEWFWHTFRHGDGQVLHMRGRDDRVEGSFLNMIPALMNPQRGGFELTHAIGMWMRVHDAQALIFPLLARTSTVRS